MSEDKLYRQKVRVARDLLGAAHPFIVTGVVVKRGNDVQPRPPMKENPLTTVWSQKGVFSP